uniref:Late blight resistance protein n=1 Tax=Solanum tuberosum TaxID=4113 RepID=Q0KIJ3_SOLTU|nr:hypothetical protein STB1_57t00002 [Solanum tuberosum]
MGINRRSKSRVTDQVDDEPIVTLHRLLALSLQAQASVILGYQELNRRSIRRFPYYPSPYPSRLVTQRLHAGTFGELKSHSAVLQVVLAITRTASLQLLQLFRSFFPGFPSFSTRSFKGEFLNLLDFPPFLPHPQLRWERKALFLFMVYPRKRVGSNDVKLVHTLTRWSQRGIMTKLAHSPQFAYDHLYHSLTLVNWTNGASSRFYQACISRQPHHTRRSTQSSNKTIPFFASMQQSSQEFNSTTGIITTRCYEFTHDLCNSIRLIGFAHACRSNKITIQVIASIILRWMLGQTPQYPNKTKLREQNNRVLRKARRLTTDSGVLNWINGMLDADLRYLHLHHNKMQTNWH